MRQEAVEPDPAAKEGRARDVSRREFLRLAALGLLALAFGGILEACKGRTEVATPTLAPSPSLTPTASPTPPATTPSPLVTPLASANVTPSAAASDAYPDLVVTRQGEPEVLVRRAVEALGGMQRFVPSGASVIVKPNACMAYRSYEFAATTNPWVVGTLVKMAFEAGAKSVKVLDYPWGGSSTDAYGTSGIAEQVEAAGGQMVGISSRHFVAKKLPDAKWLMGTEVYDEVVNADVIINAPIAKQHGSTGLTLGMKNLMGLVRDRGTMHNNLHQAIADLNTLIRPQLTVVDCVRILLRNGPSGGNLKDVKKLDTVIAGTDVVAADSYAATLFGMKPNSIGYIKIGAAMGLGRSDLENLTIQEISV
jgi:uncharacterized protein (DUF362 family)